LDFSVLLFEVVTIDLHYMTDRQERFDLKMSKLKILRKQRPLHLGCPWGKIKHIKHYFKVNYPFKRTQNPQYWVGLATETWTVFCIWVIWVENELHVTKWPVTNPDNTSTDETAGHSENHLKPHAVHDGNYQKSWVINNVDIYACISTCLN